MHKTIFQWKSFVLIKNNVAFYKCQPNPAILFQPGDIHWSLLSHDVRKSLVLIKDNFPFYKLERTESFI